LIERVLAMAWIPLINRENAGPELQKIYAEIGATRGRVANILAVTGLHPQALAAHFDLYKNLMFAASPLTRRQREMIAVVVSATNECHY
jgi:alkylhydroperoxidase family enzyme